MQKQNGGRPTILPKMYEEPLFSQIIDKIESGCNDREIYTNLHCSAKTLLNSNHRDIYFNYTNL